jgi:hypothetical protein
MVSPQLEWQSATRPKRKTTVYGAIVQSKYFNMMLETSMLILIVRIAAPKSVLQQSMKLCKPRHTYVS